VIAVKIARHARAQDAALRNRPFEASHERPRATSAEHRVSPDRIP
jgi:hypothetical protein